MRCDKPMLDYLLLRSQEFPRVCGDYHHSFVTEA
jgi:hypothetical protein